MHFVLPFFHPVTGGVETRVRELGARLAARGHEVTVHAMACTPAGEPLPPRDRVDGIAVERVKPSLRRGGYLLFFRPRLPPGGLVDVHAYPFLPGDWLRLTERRRLCLVHTPQGAPFRPPRAAQRAMLRAYDALLGLPTLRRARRVVVITGNEARWLAARGVEPERIVEVPNGVPDEAFRPREPGLAKERWGLDRYVLFLGRLYREKGPLDLVEALGLLAAEFPGLGAVFAGPDQGEGPRLARRARERGLAERVVLAGRVGEEEKWRLLAGCEALALPSLWEAQGIVVLEAWAQGRPVVATGVGGLPFVVEHGRTGLLVPPAEPLRLADALRKLLQEPARARAMGEAGREAARQRYRWGALAERLERVYEAALREAAAGPGPAKKP